MASADRRPARGTGRSPVRRTIERIGVIAVAAGAAALIGFVIWAQNPLRSDPVPLAAARADQHYDYVVAQDTISLIPHHPDGTGLLFLPGARVSPFAYVATLRGIADAGTTVVIVRPLLNFAIFEYRSPGSFESAAPDVDRWYVGGHSLGGVKACQWAGGGGFRGLVLFGSYCADDLSDARLRVLSLAGARDGLSTPAKVAAARHLLPADATMVEIPGAVHAQFGAYGTQPGDGTPTASDATVRAAITEDAVRFLDGG